MQKKKKTNLRALTAGAMMAALSIILERVIPMMPASNMMNIRISLSNVPIILAGILINPAIGAVCGVVSDIVGCSLSGYVPFLPLTIAPLITGFLPAVILNHSKEKAEYSFWRVLTALTITHILSSVLVTTAGLCLMRGTPFVPMLITRLPSCAINLGIDISLVYLLLKSPLSKKI